MSSVFESTFKLVKYQNLQKNIKQVMKDAKQIPLPRYLGIKIHNESLLKEYTEEKILEKIKTDEMYALRIQSNKI